jgi:uncharacterized protein DUF4337
MSAEKREGDGVGERYTSGEAMEHVEKTHGLLERSEHAVLRHVPLVAAALAVLAGLSSLLGARTGEAMLASRTESVLAQARATDVWNEYEADSIKAHINETAAFTAGTPASREALSAAARTYRARQAPLRKTASAAEAQRDSDLARSEVLEHRKELFDIAVALFEIAIVLTSIAAMVKQPPLLVVAAAIAAAAIVFDALGLLTT